MIIEAATNKNPFDSFVQSIKNSKDQFLNTEKPVLKSSSSVQEQRPKEFSKILSKSILFGSIGTLAATVYIGTRYIRRLGLWGESTILNATSTIFELLSDLFVKNSSTTVDFRNISGTYICLLFDCDKSLENEEDLKARDDYFRLLANLTAKVEASTTTIYIPGRGNSHVIEKNSAFQPFWYFLSSSSKSLGKAIALRKNSG